ncbi:DUF1289 domain-containing protein [uncultured Vibrio sp.]|uniref:DUF1289 domain-containing protein n=1 Tax=uncultured Vibrio sp. TaxID=114054 RepID=UPI0025EBB562|nr:DUF1289 domain-containing protein [uncultured Vibrio sp.]
MEENKNNNLESREIQSPCIRHCCLNENDLCLGCYRTLDEILSWNASSDTEKLEILGCCARRKIQRG